MKRSISTIALSAFALSAASLGFARANNAPPPVTAPATPAPAPSATPQVTVPVITGAKNPKATPAPPKDEDANRVGLTGVWEIALQRPDGVVYTHFKLTQTGTTLTGQYLDESGKKFPLAGTIDGKKVRVVVSMSDGSALVFSGTEDGNSDMMGTLSTAKAMIGFTAGYRPKYKWIDNISPGGSGLGSMGNPGGNP